MKKILMASLLAVVSLSACKKNSDCGKDLLTKMEEVEKKIFLADNDVTICNKKKFVGKVSDCSKEDELRNVLMKEHDGLKKQLLEMNNDCSEDLLTKIKIVEKKFFYADNDATVCNKKKFIGKVSDCSKEDELRNILMKEHDELKKQLLEKK